MKIRGTKWRLAVSVLEFSSTVGRRRGDVVRQHDYPTDFQESTCCSIVAPNLQSTWLQHREGIAHRDDFENMVSRCHRNRETSPSYRLLSDTHRQCAVPTLACKAGRDVTSDGGEADNTTGLFTTYDGSTAFL